MKPEIVQTLTINFEEKVNKTSDGVEFWFARDLQKLLGYTEWRNFKKVIDKAIESCRNTGTTTKKHFVETNRPIKFGSINNHDITDYSLTRYACYLVAQNGDPTKTEIAFAQTYFAIQTRKLELIEERIRDIERLKAREKLTESDKQLSGVIFEKTKDEKSIGRIKNFGDSALFNNSTKQMKSKWKIPKNKPLADFAPTVIIKGKDFANELTIFNTKEKGLGNEKQLTREHIENNKTIRKAMIERGIIPEKLNSEQDINKLKKRMSFETKRELKLKE